MAEVIAKVTEENSKVEGGLVELSNGETTLKGRVSAVSENEFVVDWEDGARTVESKSDYELVVEPRTAAENPAQPAGFAVPPVDADAHPGGELMAIEQEKRAETAQWEDSQNREPVDGPNPAQPAGWAVPEATGAPIPGQGADGLLFAARVVADDITGEGGNVEITNGNLRVAGKILAADDETFIVEWEDERRTVENKSDYDLVITASDEEDATEEEN